MLYFRTWHGDGVSSRSEAWILIRQNQFTNKALLGTSGSPFAAVFGLERRKRKEAGSELKVSNMVALFRGVFAFEMVLSHEMERRLI
jgi:hypothetical protein